MTQQELPIWRQDDPETSKISGQQVIEGSSRSTQCKTLYEAVRSSPGLTAGEYADLTGLGMHVTSRRLADLKNQNQIVQGEPQVYSGTGRLQVTWFSLIDLETHEDLGW